MRSRLLFLRLLCESRQSMRLLYKPTPKQPPLKKSRGFSPDSYDADSTEGIGIRADEIPSRNIA